MRALILSMIIVVSAIIGFAIYRMAEEDQECRRKCFPFEGVQSDSCVCDITKVQRK